jgi:hypothetical protein
LGAVLRALEREGELTAPRFLAGSFLSLLGAFLALLGLLGLLGLLARFASVDFAPLFAREVDFKGPRGDRFPFARDLMPVGARVAVARRLTSLVEDREVAFFPFVRFNLEELVFDRAMVL